MKPQSIRKALGTAAIVALGLMVSACLLTPGKFDSTLDLRKDGAFRFSYDGELYMLPFSKLADKNGPFEQKPCHETGTGAERPCTSKEIAQQKQDWQRETEKNKREAESARVFLGGLDPSDPEAAAELAERLRNQEGWNQVEYLGDGLFDVQFSVTGHLSHDFGFPTIERFPMAGAFVRIALHKDGTVRVDAPGFGPSSGAAPFGNMMQFAAKAAEEEGKTDVRVPEMDGTFTINTDGEILANNTDTGPQAAAMGRSLTWKVNSRSAAAPTALVRLTD